VFSVQTLGRAIARLRAVTGLVLVLLAVSACPTAQAQPADQKPAFLRQLDRQFQNGDWVLQCDSWIACRILGVVAAGQNDAETRPVVIIDRGWKKDAAYRVQLAFIDGYGQTEYADPNATWRVSGRSGREDAFRFELRPANDAKVFGVAPESADGLIHRLRQFAPARLDDGTGPAMRLPRGDLGALLKRMDQLQRPAVDPLSAEQRAVWMKPYRFIVTRGAPTKGADIPADVLRSCNTKAQAQYTDGWRLDSEHLFWIAHCPEGSRMFLHKAGARPVAFDLRRFSGNLQRDVYAQFDPDTSLLTVKLSQDMRGDCGHRVRFGWTTEKAFGMIEHRRLVMCRGVPADFWPPTWTPTSWRYSEPGP
jgi:hypothetical protein